MTEEIQPKARWRWFVHTLVLALFPLSIGILGFIDQQSVTSPAPTPMLPKTVAGLFWITLDAFILFGLFFLVAWFFSRATCDQLLLRWRNHVMPFFLGLGYSIALRLMVAMIIIGAIIVLAVSGENMEQASEKLRPDTESVTDFKALMDPVYLTVAMTWVSFVLAGFREEMWRAGMFAGLAGMFPKFSNTIPGKIVFAAVIAVLFGVGHLPQGLAGVFLTGFLGFGLGLIMIFHRSIWEAVFAHGFFNATTFLMIWAMQKYFGDHPALKKLFN